MSDEMLLQRIQKLERSQAIMRSLLIVVLLACLGAFVLGSGSAQIAKPNVIRATRFVLLDKDGRERAVLGKRGEKTGLFLFSLNQQTEEPLVELYIEPQEGNLTAAHGRAEFRDDLFSVTNTFISSDTIGIWNSESKHNIYMSNLATGYISLTLSDRSKMAYIELAHSDTEGPHFKMRAPLGIEDASKKMRSRDGNNDALWDAYIRSLRLRVLVKPFTDPEISVWKDNKVMWKAP